MDRARSRRYLAAIGIPLWRPRSARDGTGEAGDAGRAGLRRSESGDALAASGGGAPTSTSSAPSESSDAHRNPSLPPRTEAADASPRAGGDAPTQRTRPRPAPSPTAGREPPPASTAAAASTPDAAGGGAPRSTPSAPAPATGAAASATTAVPVGRARPAADDAPPPYDDIPPWIDADYEIDDFGAAPDGDAPADRDAPSPVAAMDWDALEQAVAGCRACGLCERRTNTVFGVGDRNAELMFVGEAPGHDEDLKGEPFVGRAGQLLDRMLAAVDMTRSEVYIANVVKCRPPNNRNPQPEEAAACRAYLMRQIELVAPKLLVSLGGVSATNLLGNEESVGRLRNKIHSYGANGTALVVTYHPSYYLRSPAEKAKGWQDLQRIVALLREARAATGPATGAAR